MRSRRRNSLFLTAVFVLASPLAAQFADDVWNTLMARGMAYQNSKDLTHAELTFMQALHEAERFGPEDPRVATTLTSLGLNYRHQKKFAEAESAYRRALAIIEKGTDDEETMDVAEGEYNLAAALVEGGRSAAAIPLLQKAVTVYESDLGGFTQRTADVLCLLGDAYRLQKNFTDAERPLRRCADLRQANGGMDDLEFAEALYSLALAYMGEGKYALAEPRFTLAEKIREKRLGITSHLLAQTMLDHAVLLKKLGRDPEAARLNTMASAILKRTAK